MTKNILTFSFVSVVLFMFSCAERPYVCPEVDENGNEMCSTDMGDTQNPDTDMGAKDVGPITCEPECGNGEVCKVGVFECVACVDDSTCTDQVCNLDSNTCVDCIDNSLCTEVGASTCDGGTCGACVMDDDCAHLEGTPRCDSGTCKVECEDDSHCGGKVCDVTTQKCTTESPASAGQCESCVSDTQCNDGYHCVALGFGSPDPVPRGNYCLQIRPAGGCAKPYRIDIDRASLNGAPAERHCGVSEELTTCEAVLAATSDTECKDDNDATMADPSKCLADSGARCEDLSGGWTCTYSCGTNAQCPNGQTCLNIVGGIGYCG